MRPIELRGLVNNGCNLSSLGSSGGAAAADLTEVMCQDSPANPALHTGLAVIAAAAESKAALQHADATFDSSSEAARAAKRRALLNMAATSTQWTLVRQCDAADATRRGNTYIGTGRKSTLR